MGLGAVGWSNRKGHRAGSRPRSQKSRLGRRSASVTKRREPTVADLPKHCVEVVEAGQRAAPGWQPCEIGRDISFDTKSLESYCYADWHPAVYDAFLLAAAVEYGDRGKRRRRGAWGREISVRVKVHDPARWDDADVGGMLAVLTGDRWNFEFMPREEPVPRPRQVSLTMDDGASAVIPFSDGLDSLAVSSLMEQEYGRILRVRLGRLHNQDDRLPFAGVPFRVTSPRAPESSFRSRSFKFELLAGIAAFLAGLNKIVVTESGQGILGPSLLPLGHEHEDVGCHPRFLDCMSAFLKRMFGVDVRYVYPRIWHTKGETLIEYFRICPDQGDAWRKTKSCWQDQRHSSVGGTLRQCGICIACLLRRMSLYAAECVESPTGYVWENLAESSFRKGAAKGYEARSEVMHDHFVSAATGLDQLAKLHRSPWDQHTLDRQVRRLCRSANLVEGGSLRESDVRARVMRLLEQHAREWREFKESLGKSSFLVQLVEGGTHGSP